MRAELGLLALAAAFAGAGTGVLAGLGIVRSPGQALRGLGLAYLTGMAAVMLVGLVVTVAGAAFDLAACGAVCLAVACGGVVAARARARDAGADAWAPRAPTGMPGWRRGLIAAASLAALAYVVMGLLTTAVTPLNSFDAWSIWGRKAVMLFGLGHLPAGALASSAYSFMHPDYPILLPLWESLQLRAIGHVDTQLLHVPFWLLLVAFLSALGFVGRRVSRWALVAPIVAAAALAPGVVDQVVSANADVPMACFLAIGVLSLGIWLERGDRAALALGALQLAAAANVKNEGLVGAVVVLAVAAAIVALDRRWRALRALAFGAAAVAAAVAPWRIWTAAHGIHGDLPVGNGLTPSYLSDRSDRIRPAFDALVNRLADQGRWSYIVPAALALMLVCLLVRWSPGSPGRRLAAFYLGTAVAFFALVLWSLVVIPNTLDFQLPSSAPRLISGIVFVGLAALIHLSGALDDKVRAVSRA
ncbi:MAG: hypothetical protein QOD76_1015 [Solirubrobacteraceae bacterium]|nr:hypothetical protein [Solirubrobacteraceae bacterium]